MRDTTAKKKPRNFKSKAAYRRSLAHGHASEEFEETPGNQKVKIRGKPHKVHHSRKRIRRRRPRSVRRSGKTGGR